MFGSSPNNHFILLLNKLSRLHSYKIDVNLSTIMIDSYLFCQHLDLFINQTQIQTPPSISSDIFSTFFFSFFYIPDSYDVQFSFQHTNVFHVTKSYKTNLKPLQFNFLDIKTSSRSFIFEIVLIYCTLIIIEKVREEECYKILHLFFPPCDYIVS